MRLHTPTEIITNANNCLDVETKPHFFAARFFFLRQDFFLFFFSYNKKIILVPGKKNAFVTISTQNFLALVIIFVRVHLTAKIYLLPP